MRKNGEVGEGEQLCAHAICSKFSELSIYPGPQPLFQPQLCLVG